MKESINCATDGFRPRNLFAAAKQRQFSNLFLRKIDNGSHGDIVARYQSAVKPVAGTRASQKTSAKSVPSNHERTPAFARFLLRARLRRDEPACLSNTQIKFD
jgi:hypothetical protein